MATRPGSGARCALLPAPRARETRCRSSRECPPPCAGPSAPTRPPFLSLALAALASPARGATPEEVAAAEATFSDGKKAAAAGDYGRACPKFAESLRLDPGTGTALNLGDCLEHLGRLASSWGMFREAAALARAAGDSGRQGEAERRAGLLEPLLPKIVIVLSPATRLPSIAIKRDGNAVGEGQWGSPVPIDAGEHLIEASAPGKKPWRATLTVEPKPGVTTIEVPALEDAPPGSPEAGPAPRAFWVPQRLAGLGVGLAGVAALAAGGAVGGAALAKYGATKGECLQVAQRACTAPGVAARSTALKLADASTGLLIGGAGGPRGWRG